MKKFSKLAIILLVVMALILPTAAEAKSKGSSTRHSSHSVSSKKVNPNHGPTHKVRGYTKKNGTKVAPYQRTKANKTKKDNLRIAK